MQNTAGSNIMFDRRVVRGNTYAAQILPATAQAEQMELQKSNEIKRKQQSGKRQPPPEKPATPEAVDGRKHIDVQTENYLEELTDKVIEHDVDTQTDAFMDRPPSPIFIPMKTGVDIATQIYEGELFDFDTEVDPILEVLVGKTLEQSMMEVMEEEELLAMRQHQEKFEQIRNAELTETQRMEEAEKRRFEEKERRMAQEKSRLQQEQQVTEKVAARSFTKGYLSDLHTKVFANLSDAGFFYNPLEKEVKTNFLPWLMNSMHQQMDAVRVAHELADDLIASAVNRNAEMAKEAQSLREKIEEAKAKEAEAERLAAEKAAAEKAAAEKAAAEAAEQEG